MGIWVSIPLFARAFVQMQGDSLVRKVEEGLQAALDRSGRMCRCP